MPASEGPLEMSDDVAPPLEEGWYLMSVSELEQELARWREPGTEHGPSAARRLSPAEAMARRDAGNLPDEQGRRLRLVLHVEGGADSAALDARRRHFEPDYHDPPTWRGHDSAPVNVVPLRLTRGGLGRTAEVTRGGLGRTAEVTRGGLGRTAEVTRGGLGRTAERSERPETAAAWFDRPELAALEREWRATGAIGGLRIPADVRGFVYKTVLSLRSAGHAVNVDTVSSSIARWTSPDDAAHIRVALEDANQRA
jgi:hypothetical protein